MNDGDAELCSARYRHMQAGGAPSRELQYEDLHQKVYRDATTLTVDHDAIYKVSANRY